MACPPQRAPHRANGCFEARIERFLEHDQNAVWAMLTDPARLPLWLAPGELSLKKGGPARLNFPESGTVIDSRVSAIDPPRLIEYSWSGPGEPERPLCWETTAQGRGTGTAQPGATQLVLTLRIPLTEDIARSCAGWEAHLEMLVAALEGVPIKFPFDRFKAMREAYQSRGTRP
jgi:uncharacterized protein YndB with AHSA1/START domain